jgi:hypothetical protein
MRFWTRSLYGLTLLALTLGLLALAAGSIRQAIAVRDAEEASRPPGSERVFAVGVARLEPVTATRVLTDYGDLQSSRQLELRAATGGTLLELAPGFRDGGRVTAGETLFRIDPAEADTTLRLAESDLAAATAEEAEARVGLTLAREELAAAARQRDLRAQAQARAEDLQVRGVGSAANIETAELALATSEQVLTGRRLALAEAEARIDRAEIAVTRAGIARDEAARVLANTDEAAPFDGVLAEVDAVPGRLVSPNEKLGMLIDPAALEVAFRVSSAEFARLADSEGGLLPLPVTASLEIDGIALSVPGRIDRAGAAVGAGQTGRLIYARLDADRPGLLRPGDFLTVRVEEPALQDVAVLPATALGPGSTILVLDADARLEEVPVTVLRRQGDAVIVADAPFGRDVVTERQPQLGPGVQVRPAGPGPQAAEPTPEAMVRLSPERRAGLIAAVEANRRLPDDARARILAALEAEEVPQSMIDRLERRSGG